MLKQPQNMKGMSYLEIIVCFFVISLLVLPLSTSFLSAIRVREAGVDLSQSTFQTERLMEEIKEQLRKDSLNVYKLNIAEKSELSYLFGGPLEASDYISKTYQTDRYDYEVAIWPLKEQIGSTTISALSAKDDSCKAFRFYTAADANSAFKYKSEEESQLPQLNMASSANLFLSTGSYLYTPALGSDSLNLSTIKGMATILFKQNEHSTPLPIVEVDSVTCQNLTIIKKDLYIADTKQGYSFEIQQIQPTETTGTNMVIIDTQLLQDFSEVTTTNIKIKNKSQLPLLVKIVVGEVKIEEDKTEEDKILAEEVKMTAMENIIKLTLEDSSINGKTSIEKVFSKPMQEGYLISIVVRDKEPKLGQSGKIVKTMMDFLTFEPDDN